MPVDLVAPKPVATFTTFRFSWDPAKARANMAKHGVSFDVASEVFKDPLAVTIPDDDHSDAEQRWITLGRTGRSFLLVTVHTWREPRSGIVEVRLISARRASRRERRQYEEGAP